MIQVSCAGVNVAYRRAPILKNISFEAEGGELIGVIGPNGAGKSTLIRALAGLQPHSGNIDWNAKNAPKITADERARKVSYMPQDRTVHWAMSCLDVVLLGRLPHHSQFAGPSKSDQVFALAAMQKMEVEGFADRSFDTLSGGEKARVLIARMLAQDPACYLADEPGNGLDPAHQISLMQSFQDFARAGRLVFVSLHDLTLAGRWCNRLLLLEHGLLKADGPPSDLFRSGLIEKVYGIETLEITLEGRRTVVPAAVQSVSPKGLHAVQNGFSTKEQLG